MSPWVSTPALEIDEEATMQLPEKSETRSLPDDEYRWDWLPICHDNLNRLS